MTYVVATFEKTGNLKYISHLDLQRAMTRLLLRSGLPICFSEGFNPHPKLTFAQPLSLFQESVCECMEFRMDGALPTEQEALEALRSASPDQDLLFTSVRYSERKCPPCLSASYELTFRTELDAQAFAALLDLPLTVTKKTKSKELLLDISPLIGNKTVTETENGVCLSCTLPCGDGYLNPSYLGVALEGRATLTRVLRTKLFFA